MDTKTILLDIGGTFIKCSDGRQIPIDSAGSRDAIASALREAIGDASRVAVAIPGPFDYENGIFLMKHKFASVYGERFAELAGRSCSYRFVHDVNAALMGEMKGHENIALITLGTGLGFAYSLNGKVQSAPSGSPARAIYNIPCGDGILEDYVSKRGITAAYARLGGNPSMSVREIADNARSGDHAALKAFSESASILAHYLGPVLRDLGISKVVLGGQISRSFDLMEKDLKHGLGPYVEVTASEDIGGSVFRGISRLFDN